MADVLERKDTFFVRQERSDKKTDAKPIRLETLTFPNGTRVHALERKVFERAVRDAMSPSKK